MDRVVAIDDGYFPLEYKGCRGYTILLAVGYSVSKCLVESIAYGYVVVDGVDATYRAVELVEAIGEAYTIILDGVTYAGFNYIDPYRLYRDTGIPVIVFYRHPLSLDRIRNALYKNFNDAGKRYSVIEKALVNRVDYTTKWGLYQYTPVGVEPLEARWILEKLAHYSPEPEPLRIADKLASQITRTLHRYGRI